MSRINDLIKELCPNGVKKYTVKDICLVTRGRVISKMELQKNIGEYPVYSSQTLNNGVFGKINTYDFEGQYVQWTTDGANAGSIFYRNGKFSVTNVCGLLKVKDEYFNVINTNYLSYALTMESKKYKNLYFTGEVTDIDGDTGGYNLQYSFASAYRAAANINKSHIS